MCKINKFLILFFFCSGITAQANNVEIANISLTGADIAADTKLIEFDVSWENSWRTSASPFNWDGVWVFAKYRLTADVNWHHATLGNLNANHTASSGSTVDAVSDGMGVFIYRDADGAGNNSFINTQLLWEYGIDGLADADSVEICVFAIEMVYIPDGDFSIGDGNGTLESTYAFELIPNTNNFVTITNALSSTFETNGVDDAQLGTTGLRVDGDGGIDENNDGTVDHPNFPVGYNAYYCMKYEISQGQFVEFANHINGGQANIISAITTSRRNISGSGSSWSSTTPNRAHGMGYPPLAGYLDWSGLRPMSETEYEKTCRGSNTPLLNEFAWGTTNIFATAYTIGFDGTASEIVTNIGVGTGNAVYATTLAAGMARCGIFAASSPSHTREETGGTFYGVMEMSGNVRECVVVLGDTDGRDFDGSHGDGEVNVNAYSDNSGWPGHDGSQIDGSPASGWGYRGGGENNGFAQLGICDRNYVNTHTVGTTSTFEGGRGVRTAP